jgi:hypothetical protein
LLPFSLSISTDSTVFTAQLASFFAISISFHSQGLMGSKEPWLPGELGPEVDHAPPTVEPSCYNHRSIETLVVVLAVITILGVIAGIIARLCGGRHFGNNGENDIEGWIERRCRSCIDGGVPAAAVEPKPAAAAAAAEEAKK